MENVSHEIKGDELILRVKLDPKQAQPSASGKTKLVASTHGMMPVSFAKLPGLKVALNVTIPN